MDARCWKPAGRDAVGGAGKGSVPGLRCLSRSGSRGTSRAGRSAEGRADKAGLSAGRAGERKRGGCCRRGAEQVRREPGLCHAGTGSGRAGGARGGAGAALCAPGERLAPRGTGRDGRDPFTRGQRGVEGGDGRRSDSPTAPGAESTLGKERRAYCSLLLKKIRK